VYARRGRVSADIPEKCSKRREMGYFWAF